MCYARRHLFQLIHLLLLSLIDWGQIVLNHLVLPVVDGAVSLLPHICVVLILDVHPRVVGVVSYTKLTEFLSEELSLTFYCLPELRLLLFLSYLALLPLNES